MRMSEINLFELISNGQANEITSSSFYIEKKLQSIIEKNMSTFFGVRFIESEYRIDNGRIDSLGIDENNNPVIFEYKRSSSENVINQGLFYMDWLVSHKDAFYVLVMKKLGKEIADKIDWSLPRLYCVANNFTKFDENAIRQMSRNISLYRYRLYGDKHILFELLGSNVVNKDQSDQDGNVVTQPDKKYMDQTFSARYEKAPQKIKVLYENIKSYTLSLGDDVTENQLKLYTAFKKVKNFMCVEIHPSTIILYLKLDPAKETLVSGFSRDVTNIGHWGTGDLEVTITDDTTYEQAKHLIEKAYFNN